MAGLVGEVAPLTRLDLGMWGCFVFFLLRLSQIILP